MAIDYLGRIRSFLAALPETIDAFLVVTGDPWGSEYLPDHWALRAHLTGFTGSAGTLLLRRAAPHVLWTDSRYTLAAMERCRALGLVFCEEHRPLERELPDKVRGLAVGFDPETLSEAEVRRLEAALEEVDARLIAVPDALRSGWTENRPAEVAAPLFRIDPPEASSLRLARLRDTMEEGESTLVGPEETAWFTHLPATRRRTCVSGCRRRERPCCSPIPHVSTPSFLPNSPAREFVSAVSRTSRAERFWPTPHAFPRRSGVNSPERASRFVKPPRPCRCG